MIILADESVDYRIITFLREQGFKVEAIIDNDSSIPDMEVLQKANEAKAVLITEDKDFGELVFRLKLEHRGVLLLRFFDLDIQIKKSKVFEVFNMYGKQLSNNFSTLTEKRLRIRYTP